MIVTCSSISAFGNGAGDRLAYIGSIASTTSTLKMFLAKCVRDYVRRAS